jgi:hypothetical protein
MGTLLGHFVEPEIDTKGMVLGTIKGYNPNVSGSFPDDPLDPKTVTAIVADIVFY